MKDEAACALFEGLAAATLGTPEEGAPEEGDVLAFLNPERQGKESTPEGATGEGER